MTRYKRPQPGDRPTLPLSSKYVGDCIDVVHDYRRGNLSRSGPSESRGASVALFNTSEVKLKPYHAYATAATYNMKSGQVASTGRAPSIRVEELNWHSNLSRFFIAPASVNINQTILNPYWTWQTVNISGGAGPYVMFDPTDPSRMKYSLSGIGRVVSQGSYGHAVVDFKEQQNYWRAQPAEDFQGPGVLVDASLLDVGGNAFGTANIQVFEDHLYKQDDRLHVLYTGNTFIGWRDGGFKCEDLCDCPQLAIPPGACCEDCVECGDCLWPPADDPIPISGFSAEMVSFPEARYEQVADGQFDSNEPLACRCNLTVEYRQGDPPYPQFSAVATRAYFPGDPDIGEWGVFIQDFTNPGGPPSFNTEVGVFTPCNGGISMAWRDNLANDWSASMDSSVRTQPASSATSEAMRRVVAKFPGVNEQACGLRDTLQLIGAWGVDEAIERVDDLAGELKRGFEKSSQPYLVKMSPVLIRRRLLRALDG